MIDEYLQTEMEALGLDKGPITPYEIEVNIIFLISTSAEMSIERIQRKLQNPP